MGKTYGTLGYAPPSTRHPAGVWGIRAEPYVMVRIKRMFGRVSTDRSGTVIITNTPDIARDIEWLLERYPLKATDETRAALKRGADQARAREEAVERILAGGASGLAMDERPLTREPRWYQSQAAEMAAATGRLLITDPLGSGKTFTGLLTLRAPDALPALVVTLSGRMPKQWCEEAAKTMPWLKTHVALYGAPYSDDVPRKHRDALADADVIVMNYHKLAGWQHHLAGRVRTVIFDEVQELRHPHTDRYKAATAIADQAGYVIGLSNTPIYNYGDEAFNVVDAMSKGVLGTREEFLNEWCTPHGSNGKYLVKNPPALSSYLRDLGLVLGRTEKELGIILPPPVVAVQHVESDPAVFEKLTSDAEEMARLILSQESSNWQKMQAAGQIDWRLRQATGLAKAPFVAEYVKFLLRTGEKVVLYGWHRAVYDLWMEQLKLWDPVLYTGSESTSQKNRTYREFTEGSSRLLIMSLRSGAGIDGLQQHARHVVFGELDWVPNVHKQAVGRLRRSGMDVTKPVHVHWLVSNEGSDPVIAETHNLKRMQHDPLFDPETIATPDAEPLRVDRAADLDRMKALARAFLDRQAAASSAAA